MPDTVVRNKNLRGDVTMVDERPDLDTLGRAGIRFKLDMMLLAIHGQPAREWRKLDEQQRAVLRQMAREEDPAWGVTHQIDAIGALAELKDKAALLQLSELARNAGADMRLQIAATHALGEIGGAQARPVLRDLLAAKDPAVRAQAAKGLVKAGSAVDIAALESAAGKDKSFAGAIAKQAAGSLRARLALLP